MASSGASNRRCRNEAGSCSRPSVSVTSHRAYRPVPQIHYLPGLVCAGALAQAPSSPIPPPATGLPGTRRCRQRSCRISDRLEAHGLIIPALHDAANDQPIRYTPVCLRAKVPICLHPAYRSYLTDVTAALGPVLREVTGLPGAPGSVVQVPASYVAPQNIQMLGPGQGETINGSPPVLRLSLGNLGLPGAFGWGQSDFIDQLRLLFAHTFVNAGRGGGRLSQQVVQAALLEGAGVPFAAQPEVLASDGLPSAPPGPGL